MTESFWDDIYSNEIGCSRDSDGRFSSSTIPSSIKFEELFISEFSEIMSRRSSFLLLALLSSSFGLRPILLV